MALKVFSDAPYYDDFDQSKNYMRILFRPGYSVQARELTQMQTALQAQIDRFGQYAFKDGSPVVGGGATFDNQYAYVRLESAFTYSANNYDADSYADEIVAGRTLTGLTTGVTATVLEVVPVTADDPLTVFVKYTSAGSDNTTQKFASGEVINVPTSGSYPQRYLKVLTTTDGEDAYPVGFGSRVSVNEGVFFVSGNFVYTPAQSIILSKYTINPSARVVFVVSENEITSADDSTLTDNALGSPNAAAPGANRYQIDLELTLQDVAFADRDQDDIIQLIVVNEGIVASVARTELNALGDTLAQRTYEESGNYTVNPFILNMREYLNDGTNSGLYTAAQILANNPTGDIDDLNEAAAYGSARIAVGLEKSVAYVNGYRIETVDTKYVPVEKARDKGYKSDAALTAPLGNYIQINTMVGLPDVNTFSKITLKKADTTTIGYCRARSCQPVGSGTYNLYIFDVEMLSTYTLSQADNLYCSYGYGGVAFTAKVLDSGLINDAAHNTLLFELPVDTVSSLRTVPGDLVNTLYDVNRRYDFPAPFGTDGSGNVTITAASNEYFDSSNVLDWTACKDDGTVINPTSVTIGTGATSVTLNFSGYNSSPIYVVGPSRRNFQEKIKTLHANTNIALSKLGLNTTPGGYDSLGKSDVIRISAIYMSASAGVPATTSDLNVTNRYTLDDGQRDNYYDVSRIQLKSGAPAPIGDLLVVCDYLSHGSGDYFSVDSYTGQLDYKDIPSFQSSKGKVELRDCLDFRPTKNNTSTGFTGTGSSVGAMIVPNSLITLDIQYYFSRIDKIYVDKKGNFGVQKGIGSDNPVAPNDPKDSMVLYSLALPAYTFSTRTVVPSMIDNRRYTMRDIGTLDNRLKQLEYYTALSLAENQTAATTVFDANTGTPYYQNGFIVDSFTGSSTGHVTHPDYRCAIDRSNGVCRPMFYEDNVKLRYNSGASSGVRQTGPLLTLDYVEADYIAQPYASQSIFVNPFNVFSWIGKIDLTPSIDEWKETTQAPDVIVDNTGAYDAMMNMLDQSNAIGTVWNEWQTNWTGVTTTVIDQSTSVTGTGTTTSTTTSSTTQTGQSRTGLRSSITSQQVTTQNHGNLVVDVSFVPFIRSRKIYFKATGFKPNTRVYPFFDSVGVDDYVSQVSAFGGYASWDAWWNAVQYNQLDDNTNYINYSEFPGGSTPLITDSSGSVYGAFVIPNYGSIKFKTGSRIFRLTDSATNSIPEAQTFGEATYTAQGLLNTTSNLMVSTRVPVITTSTVSESRVLTDTTQATVSSTVVNAPSPSFPEPSEIPTPDGDPGLPSENPLFTWDPDDLLFQTGIRYYDPIAQTFLVDTQGGIALTSIDLFFKEKDDTLPVTVDIRTVSNGLPTQNIVPFSQVTLNPSSVNVSATAAKSTTFRFSAPVFLLQGVEYCFVVTSNSTVYKVWAAELGAYDVTNTSYRITTQPYAGVLFESKNASTWSPDQTKVIKFKMRRAAFGQSGNAVFNEVPIPARKLQNDPLQFTNASNKIVVYHPNHGMFVNSDVTIAGVAANNGANCNGIPITSINTTHTVTAVEMDNYTIEISGKNADTTGRAGGSSVTATENKTIDVMHPVIQEIVTTDAAISWTAKLTSGKSLAGSETPYVIGPYQTVKVNDNVYMNRPKSILSTPELKYISDSGTKSFYIKGSMSTTRNNVSPIIDLDRCSVITIANRIDNPIGSASTGFNEVANYLPETSAIGGSILGKYVTKQVTLNNPSSALRLYLGVNRPAASSVAVYYKVLLSGSSERFDDLGWFLVAPNSAIQVHDDPNTYDDVAYDINEADIKANFGVSTDINFTSFAVKIVFSSQNSSAVPAIRSFRAIALY